MLETDKALGTLCLIKTRTTDNIQNKATFIKLNNYEICSVLQQDSLALYFVSQQPISDLDGFNAEVPEITHA